MPAVGHCFLRSKLERQSSSAFEGTGRRDETARRFRSASRRRKMEKSQRFRRRRVVRFAALRSRVGDHPRRIGPSTGPGVAALERRRLTANGGLRSERTLQSH